MDIQAELTSRLHDFTAAKEIDDTEITATYLADQIGVQRNTVSHHLNQLVKDRRVVKVNTRPVLFFDRKVLENEHHCQLIEEYPSIFELSEALAVKEDAFSQVIGADESLYGAIRQLKSAAYYPGEGLPVLLTGPTGSGKSFLAKKYYQYCLDQGILNQSSQFIHFNCAEYADNPELLASSLFGYKRGAFTGASEDKVGLFDEADGGMLFLDEVHRLDDKGQEKLFGYLDNGLITPIGETKQGHSVQVRLIFATTEEIQSNFLQTFIRRIPVQITIPALDDRTNSEKQALALSFYLAQTQKLNQSITLWRQVLTLLSAQRFDSNVGQLKNSVVISVANALSRSIRKKEPVTVRLGDLPKDLLQQNMTNQQMTIPDNSTIELNVSDQLRDVIQSGETVHNPIKASFIRIISQSREISDSEGLIRNAKEELETLCDYLVFGKSNQNGELPLNFLKKVFTAEIKLMEQKFGIEFDGNTVVLLAHYFYNKQSLHWTLTKEERGQLLLLKKKINEGETELKTLVTMILQVVNQNVNLPTDELDELFLLLYFKNIAQVMRTAPIKCLVLAHGYATASSMANVVNKLIGASLVDAFDMPLDIGTQEIGDQITEYLAQRKVSGGLILMVDMGSLEGINHYIKGYIDFPIGITNNVSTQSVLSVAEKIKNGLDFDVIMASPEIQVKQQTKVLYPNEVKKNLIITCCQTGIGTAKQIKTLLQESLPLEMDITINAYDFARLTADKQQAVLLKTYNILAIIGTHDPEIQGVPYISLEDLIDGTEAQTFSNILLKVGKENQIKIINENIVRNFSIERVINSLTILDAHTVMTNVDQALSNYCEISKHELSNPIRMALYVHVSCLVERLIRHEPITSYTVYGEYGEQQKMIYEDIKKSFSVLETIYSVTIPDSELGYIFDIIIADY